jgi:hypothetical protein
LYPDRLADRLFIIDPELARWLVQGEDHLAKAIPSPEKAVKHVNEDTFVVMRLFRNGTTKRALRGSEELICDQSKLYKAQLSLRLYGSASYGRRACAEPSNTGSPNDRRNRARAGSLADDRRATVSGTSNDFKILLASILQHRSSIDTPHCGPVHRYASTRLQRLHSLGAENASVRTRHIATVAVEALTLCKGFSPLLCRVILC